MRKTFWIIILTFQVLLTYSCDDYEKREEGQHITHIVKIDPKNFDINIFKAESTNGRETVSSIAKRLNAQIVINGGFFEINQDSSKPSGTLIIKGKSYKIINKSQPLVIVDSKGLDIKLTNPINYADKSVVPDIPMLVQDSKISANIMQQSGAFYTSPHARSALGIRSDGKIIIVVVEHEYRRDLMSITMGEVQSLMKEKGGRHF